MLLYPAITEYKSISLSYYILILLQFYFSFYPSSIIICILVFIPGVYPIVYPIHLSLSYSDVYPAVYPLIFFRHRVRRRRDRALAVAGALDELVRTKDSKASFVGSAAVGGCLYTT
jgi:hypothetical protein